MTFNWLAKDLNFHALVTKFGHKAGSSALGRGNWNPSKLRARGISKADVGQSANVNLTAMLDRDACNITLMLLHGPSVRTST